MLRTKTIDPVSSMAPVDFAAATLENGDFNQYWYSAATVRAMVTEAESAVAAGEAESSDSDGGSNSALLAFVSTPSVFFSLSPEIRARSVLLEFDPQWQDDPGFVFYDYRKPLDLPQRCAPMPSAGSCPPSTECASSM